MKNSANQKYQNDMRKFSSATTPPPHQVKFFENKKIENFQE